MWGAVRTLLGLWLLPVLVLCWLRNQGLLTIMRLTVEPVALAGMPPWVGLLSNFGVVLWFSAASLLLFVAAQRAELRRLTLVPGLLTLWLGLDDGLMLHEEMLPHTLGISSSVVQPGLYAIYALGLVWTMRILRPWFAEPAFLILVAASLCLGGSAAIDMVRESHLLSERHPLKLDEGYAIWLEEGLKLLGIVAWWGYWAGFCRRRLEQVVAGHLE
jgi:hypothetical protein